jgi:type IX secretion system PorP/SprF family membrane protein
MRKAFTLIICMACFGGVSQAQQAPQYSMYMLNKYNFNPAYAGLDNSLSITGVFRKQWVNLESSPVTQNINAHMPLYYLRGGFGINIENDQLGAERNTSGLISYNYFVPVSKKSLLSFGIGGGVIQKSLDGSKLRAPGGDYTEPPIIDHRDNFIPVGKVSATAPLINAGIYFYSEKLEVGVSANNLIEPTATLNAEELVNIKFIRNYFFSFAYSFEISRDLTIQPSFFAKSDLVQTQLELSAIVKYSDNIFGGASFRGYNANSIDAVVFIAGYKLNEKVTLAYSYDLTLSGLSSVSKGSHEILLNYNLNKLIGMGIPPKIIYNPRFL